MGVFLKNDFHEVVQNGKDDQNLGTHNNESVDPLIDSKIDQCPDD